MSGLISEYVAAAEAMTERDFIRLEGAGVAPEIAGGLLTDYPPVGRAKIITFKDGSYQPSRDGASCYVTPVASGTLYDLELIDLVAWRPSEPERVFIRAGGGVLLNPDHQRKAYWHREPLFVFTDPLAWLRGACRGVVVLQWDAVVSHLGSTVPIWCQTSALAKRVRQAYRRHDPDVLYTKERAAA